MGAKLSGGGGGGIMIAHVDDSSREAVDSALREAGAVRTIRTEIGK
jgi:mevalonate kinase